jgi:hypothetical protein
MEGGEILLVSPTFSTMISRIFNCMAPIHLANADVLDKSALYSAASASHSGKM